MDSKNVVAFQVVTFCICLAVANSVDFGYPAVFNFGDSNSDTGELAAGMGFLVVPPYGQNYFETPSGSMCFWLIIAVDSMKFPFLNAYMDSVGLPNFQHGCKFAAAGSTILPATATSISSFGFEVQVFQFLRFRAQSLQFLQGKKFDQYVPTEDYFEKGLYMFDIGQNDLDVHFYSNYFLKKLYDSGARNFWIHNTGPLGCLPQVVAKFGTNPSKLDELGCLQAFRSKFKGQYPDANYLLGQTLNFDSQASCGLAKILDGTTITAKGCNDSSVYVIWDGTHYIEAANQYVASQILTGNYSNTLLGGKLPFLL
ncbi:hypothetical protein AAZX31_20G217600 [Glycine max]